MMIKIWIADKAGDQKLLQIPPGIGLSLMEVLLAADYPIPATCGGIALCATCLVEVMEGNEALPEAGENELIMLESLPLTAGNYRLSCQLRVDETLDSCKFRLAH